MTVTHVYPEDEYLLVQLRRRRADQAPADVAEALLAALVAAGLATDLAIVAVLTPATGLPGRPEEALER